MSLSSDSIIKYYSSHESRWGYKILLNNVKHFGYYPVGKVNISMREAMWRMQDLVAGQLNLKPGMRIMDAGCGAGEAARYISKKHKVHVTGVDIVPFNIVEAKRNSTHDHDVRFIEGDYAKLDWSNNTLDAIYTMETLVHSPNHQNALKEWFRLLRPGGRIILLEYAHDPESSLSAHESQMMRLINTYAVMPSSQVFELGVLERSLENAGFTMVSVKDLSQRIRPMLKRFWQLAFLPYQFIRILGLRHRFVNMTAGYELYRHPSIFHYKMYTAQKPVR